LDLNVIITHIGEFCAISCMLLGWISKAFKDEVTQATAGSSHQTNVSYKNEASMISGVPPHARSAERQPD